MRMQVLLLQLLFSVNKDLGVHINVDKRVNTLYNIDVYQFVTARALMIARDEQVN